MRVIILSLVAIGTCGCGEPALSSEQAAKVWASLAATEGLTPISLDAFGPERAYTARVVCPGGGHAASSTAPTWSKAGNGTAGQVSGNVRMQFDRCAGAHGVRLSGNLLRAFASHRQGPLRVAETDYAGHESVSDYFLGHLSAGGAVDASCSIEVTRDTQDGHATSSGRVCGFEVNQLAAPPR